MFIVDSIFYFLFAMMETSNAEDDRHSINKELTTVSNSLKAARKSLISRKYTFPQYCEVNKPNNKKGDFIDNNTANDDSEFHNKVQQLETTLVEDLTELLKFYSIIELQGKSTSATQLVNAMAHLVR